jgi:hypothetical protein
MVTDAELDKALAREEVLVNYEWSEWDWERVLDEDDLYTGPEMDCE